MCQARKSRIVELAVAIAAVMMPPLSLAAADDSQDPVTVQWWLTTKDLDQKLKQQPALEMTPSANPSSAGTNVIVVDERHRFQTILGLGSSLEPSTCFNLWQLPEEMRAEVLRRLVHPEEGIGINLARICIGTPDFTADAWYSYDDVPAGEQDLELERFSIEQDRRYILPVLKQALKVNPDLLFFASPWSPPGWMTSTDDMIGGHLLPEFYDVYARYLVKFIQAYQEEGVPIHAITVQNEPGVDRNGEAPRWRYPSCRYRGEQERDLIRDHLGPALVKAGLTTQIWCYDHNFNTTATPDGDDPGLDYPRTILSDPDAARYVAGVAFHGYAGKPSGMSAFHDDFPRTPLHFTEGSVFGPRGGLLLIQYLRNWASSYNGWVTMLTTEGKPNNGPFRASRTCVTVDPNTEVAYHYDYYQYGHFFRFLQRDGVRVESEGGDDRLSSVAVHNPGGQLALVVVNNDRSSRELSIVHHQRQFSVQLPAQSIATFTWPASIEPTTPK
ncbi:MAG: glycoside hydrolase family 30 beta sandwich domain-containing protein [Pirellulales bacterium]